MSSDVISMFPTLVWRVELDDPVRETIETKGIAALARLRRDLPPLAPGEGWQSMQTLHELEDFRELVASARHTVGGILKFLNIGYDAIELTACWATVLARGAAHKLHHHPNNFSERRLLPADLRRGRHDQLPRSAQPDRHHPATGHRAHRREHRPGRRAGAQWHTARVSGVARAFGRRERGRVGTDQHQLQRDVQLVQRTSHKTALAAVRRKP